MNHHCYPSVMCYAKIKVLVECDVLCQNESLVECDVLCKIEALVGCDVICKIESAC